MSIQYTERGTGRPVLLLHGGAGPASVTGFADRFAAEHPVRVITPTHPGFDGTERPAGIAGVKDLAAAYHAFLDELDLHDVVVVGNSIGGWIAAELAILDSPRIGALVIVDGVGIEVEGHPVADFFNLSFPQIAAASYYDPTGRVIDPGAMPEAARAAMAGNRATLEAYAGRPSMVDPTLRGRLVAVHKPALVVWGDSDGIADPGYGRAFAAALPKSDFVVLERTGHLPQLESPEALLGALWTFIEAS
ncbi:alpha/beta fold hydrolase [Dactylosporangium matsuzakiense]|uniref:Alpha/beta hydrolase n=1 Tax=Dactylosporangium matsuzakiense TaxID=53360 RepID=A0A9W6KVW7_9ACTN|nr:alpha/beta hydrolase [Dactylosporangium matsuzakiense]GLL07370.1 alpha/beta hydrolase [Dactylosporangium matsuzakiense]